MTEVGHKTFVDDLFDLTGMHVHHCTFDGCILILNPDPRSVIEYNVLTECRLVGLGWPRPWHPIRPPP